MAFQLPIAAGDHFAFDHVVSHDDVAAFAAITTDFSPNHLDPAAMRDSLFGGEMVHGTLLVGLMSAASTKLLETRDHVREGHVPVSSGFDKVRFLRPVRPGDALQITYRVRRTDGLKAWCDARITCGDEICAIGTNILKWVANDSQAKPQPVRAVPDDYAVFDRLVQTRRSCRAFLPDSVPKETLLEILHTAQAMPSGCNAQPWQTILLEGAAVQAFRAALSRHATVGTHNPDFPFPTEYRGVYRERRRDAAMALYGSLGIARGDRDASEMQRLRNFEFFGAPHVAVITTEETLGAYGVLDCGIYIAALVLGAQAMGIAAIPQGAPAEHSDFIRGTLNIEPGRRVIATVSFGYSDDLHPANDVHTERAPLSASCQWISSTA